MNQEYQEMQMSALLDGELGEDEFIGLLDHVSQNSHAREQWQSFRRLDALTRPALRSSRSHPVAASRRRPRRWAFAVAAALLLGLALGRIPMPATSIGGSGEPVQVVLGEARGQMSDQRFVELAVEILRAERRYQRKMEDVLASVRRETTVDESAGSSDPTAREQRFARYDTEGTGDRSDTLAFEDLSSIH